MGNYFYAKKEDQSNNNYVLPKINTRGDPNIIDMYPEDDNFKFDGSFRTEKQVINYPTCIALLEKLSKFEVDSTVFSACESQRENQQFFRIENILEDYTANELFIKVIDFNEEKRLIKDKFYGIMKKNKRIIKEYLLISQARHRTLPQVLGYFTDTINHRIYMIYENYETQLHDLIIDDLLGSFFNKLRIIKNLIEITIALHSNGTVSLDINPNSISITTKGNNIKIITFGNSVKLNEKLDIFYESWFNRAEFDIFTAPELYLNKLILSQYTWAMDIWSLGVLSMVLFYDKSDKYKKVIKSFEKEEKLIYTDEAKFNEIEFFKILSLESIDNPIITGFILSMLSSDPLIRPNIFKVADNFNSIVKYYKLDAEYLICYTEENVKSFTGIFNQQKITNN